LAVIILRRPAAATAYARAHARSQIALKPMDQNHLRPAPDRPAAPIKPEGERSGILPAEEPTKLPRPFQPLDAGIVSEAIPAFFIGRNKEGFWVAREAKGKIGGIFLFESSALSFARRKSRPRGCATIYQSERFELDLKNRGNPFIEKIGRLRHLAIAQRMIDFIDKTMKIARISL
jgi:hypothetical protein